MTRNINVFTPVVVVAQSETFNWVVQAAEIPSGDSAIEVESNDWPLPISEYTVTPTAPVSVTVPKTAATGSYDFDCDPSAPNALEQTLVVIEQLACDPCAGATVSPGGYFVWVNDGPKAATIEPDPNNANFWPLPDDRYEVPPNDWLVLQVPSNAADGEYAIIVSNPDGKGRCAALGQPKIIVTSGQGGL
jgi:hypothetical protein